MIEQDTHETPMVFRKWPNGTVTALMPTILDTPGHCLSYEHVGQHGGADYTGVVSRTQPATPQEYESLLSELRSLGYRVKVKTRR
jgi:hypothetical protein